MRKTQTVIHKPSYHIRSNFYKSPHSCTIQLLTLFDDRITYTDCKGVDKQFKLEFDLTFEIGSAISPSYSLEDSPIQKLMPHHNRPTSPTHPKSLKLFLRNQLLLTLYQKQDTIDRWQELLLKHLNQRNFKPYFQAIKKLGKGNFASVYLCKRLKDGKLFAVKAFSKEENYGQEKGKEAIENQAKISRMFTESKYIAKFEGIYESENSLYFVMEYVKGTSLQAMFDTNHQFLESQAKSILKGLLQGASQMSLKNIVHRDLKPQNIMLRAETNEPVIVDFGLATVTTQLNYLFVRCGTPGYVAPEILKIKDLTTKCACISDVFSIGCVFYYMCYGKSAFEGKKISEVLENNRNCNLNFNGDVILSIQTQDLLKKLLEPDPRLRLPARYALDHKHFGQLKQQQLKPLSSCIKQRQSHSKKHTDFKGIHQNRLKLLKSVDIKDGPTIKKTRHSPRAG